MDSTFSMQLPVSRSEPTPLPALGAKPYRTFSTFKNESCSSKICFRFSGKTISGFKTELFEPSPPPPPIPKLFPTMSDEIRYFKENLEDYVRRVEGMEDEAVRYSVARLLRAVAVAAAAAAVALDSCR